MGRVVNARKSHEKYSNSLDCARNYHTAFHLVNVFRSILNSENGKKNVVCALKNIKHRMNFTPYKLIDTTAS